MKLYHRTPFPQEILEGGFLDRTATYMTDIELTGVWFSDEPLDCNSGAKGEAMLTVNIPEGLLTQYECVEDGKPYREWIIPAAVANAHGPPQIDLEETGCVGCTEADMVRRIEHMRSAGWTQRKIDDMERHLKFLKQNNLLWQGAM